MQNLRLFIALEIAPDAGSTLLKSFTALPLERPLYRTTRLEQIHITLRFLGDTDVTALPALIDAVDVACEGMQPVTTEYTAGKAIPSGRPRTIVMGIAHTQELDRLFQKMDTMLAKRQLADRERRPFNPHCTIARLKAAPAAQDIAEIQSWTLPDVLVRADTVTLFESQLGPEGARYTALHRVTL